LSKASAPRPHCTTCTRSTRWCERSFTRAGRLLNLSQPAVSAHIRALEPYYRAPLFEVRQRRTHLTPAGEALFAYATRVFHLLTEADQALIATEQGQHGLLRFGASTTVGNHLLPSVLSGFLCSHTSVRVETEIATSLDVLAWVIAEHVQFGIVEAPVQSSDVVVEPIGQDELILVVPRTHTLAAGDPVTPDQLNDQPVVRRESSSVTQRLLDAMLAGVGVKPRIIVALGSTEALKQAVLAGIGLAWLPHLAVMHELCTGELVCLPVVGLRVSRTLNLLRLNGAQLSPAAEALLADIRRSLTPEGG